MIQQILKMSDAEIVAHGTGIAFNLETTGGTARLVIPNADLSKVLQFFASIAVLTDDGEAPPAGDLFPIRLSGLGFQESEAPDMSLLIAKIGAISLALEIPSNELERAAQKLLLAASKRVPGSRAN